MEVTFVAYLLFLVFGIDRLIYGESKSLNIFIAVVLAISTAFFLFISFASWYESIQNVNTLAKLMSNR